MNSRSVTFLIALPFLAVGAAGCSNIPQAAIEVNKQVSTGISTLGENGIAMVNAWEQSAYYMLDERWSKVYEKADASYRSKTGIAGAATLTAQQQMDVAGLSVLIRDEVREKIKSEAGNMRTIITLNTQNTLAANESITHLLASTRTLATMQQSAIQEVGRLLPIPPAISDFINSSLQAAGL